MATKNVEDLRNFDWDDSALIEAFHKGAKLMDKDVVKTKTSKKGNSSKENEKKPWKKGDYCRAEYSVDKEMYEAKICSIEDGYASIEFLGYGDQEIVHVRNLKESCGKKARRRQNKEALGDLSTASESCFNATTDGENDSRRSGSAARQHLNENQESHHMPSFHYPAAPAPENFFHAPQQQAPANHAYAGAYGAPPFPTNFPPTGSCCAPPLHNNMPYLPTPPMPPCPMLPQNPTISAMLAAWFMAGYYTANHQGQKSCQCSQHCCNHGNRCCH